MTAKELLKDKDAKFRLLFEDNPIPMWVFDRETLGLLEVNRAAVAHYGYSRDEFLAMKTSDVLAPDGAPVDRAEPAPGVAAEPLHHKLKDGRIIDVEVAAHDISYGGHHAVLAVLQDVTQRRQLEEHLRQAGKMEAVGMLAGGIAHDFNNLLTIINGYSQILLNALPLGDPNRTSVEQIMKAGERAAALTRQLLAFSRRQVSQPKVINLNQLLAGMETMLKRLIGEDIDLRVAPARDLGQVNADPGQMEQVVMNLAVNARDAMPRGGILTIETRNVDLKENQTSKYCTVQAGRYVTIAVNDNGTGMDASTRSNLFQPFFTTKGKGKGTGLGLTTVFGIVKQSGGGIEIATEPAHGTSVRVYLPRIDQPAAPEVEAPDSRVVRGSETILLVEDEDLVRTLVRDTLRRDGYNVLDAPDAAEARRICQNYSGTIHLLISDVVMPKEGGRELAQTLLSQRPEMKVLFMSGYTDQAILDSRVPGADSAFIQKPFTPAALSRIVREVLERNGYSIQAGG